MNEGIGMKREDELIAAGWERRFIACEPRLSEMVAMYKEIGFEVLLEPLPSKEEMDQSGLRRERVHSLL